ncbi:MAG: tRNA lysidine(34) synthetase TilS [Treponema sp.]|nr:tRNA lysidine(34) synthetase TilS [Treponema sp.]
MDKNIFEEKVLECLNKYCFSEQSPSPGAKLKVGAAVSGGADSVSLLISLSNILTARGITLYVITVNHYIRKDEETCGDVKYVENLCNQLKNQNKLVEFHLVELDRGQVFNLARERALGIEEAARFLRYQAFDNFIQAMDLDFLCLAHNKNDNYETLLMRFLQGASCQGLRGISTLRNKYLRPLLNISRAEIEAYLKSLNISYRSDSTNFDTDYLRNKIRLELIPFLNKKFPSWQKGLENDSLWASEDFEIIEERLSALKKDLLISGDSASYDLASFNQLSQGLKKRLLLYMANQISDYPRIPAAFLQEVCKSLEKVQTDSSFSKYYKDLEVQIKNHRLFVKKFVKSETDLVFFAIIEESGEYNFPFGSLRVEKKGDFYEFEFLAREKVICSVKELPVCVRNLQLDDQVICKNGSYKKVSAIFSDWHVKEEEKPYIPLIQKLTSAGQDIICLPGGIFGYENWFVKD